MDASLAEELAAALGAPVGHHQPVHGGDTTDAWRVELADGRTAFVKTRAGAPPGFFEGEADGLEAIASTGAVAVPVVLAVGTRFLALEWVEGGGDLDAVRLGRELAALHRSAPPVPPLFGWRRANFVGAVLQDNTPCASWPEFYATRRLEPLVRANVDRGRLPATAVGALDQLTARLDALTGPAEPPALLHGDLWGGNCLALAGGEPVLVDPAVYAGHREVDLAMMRLFGGFAPTTFAAYDEAFPLADGHAERVGLYQLYPLLVHVTMFGGGYARSFLDSLARYR